MLTDTKNISKSDFQQMFYKILIYENEQFSSHQKFWATPIFIIAFSSILKKASQGRNPKFIFYTITNNRLILSYVFCMGLTGSAFCNFLI
jgi:hypothetical protein